MNGKRQGPKSLPFVTIMIKATSVKGFVLVLKGN